MVLRATLAVALGLIVYAAVSTAAVRSQPKTHVVVMERMEFRPAVLTAKSGDIIVWVNKDLVPHTATADSFDSMTIPAGKSWKYTVRTKGDFGYGCTFHPTMRGTLQIE
jgi:plastocyanin